MNKPENSNASTPASGSDASPAEVFPVCDFILEEMQARGWTLDDLINHMPGNRRLNRLTMEIQFLVPSLGPESRAKVRVGDETASDLAHAFGTTKEYWLNLDASWVKHQNGALCEGAKGDDEKHK